MKKQAEVKGKRPNGKKKRVYSTGRVRRADGRELPKDLQPTKKHNKNELVSERKVTAPVRWQSDPDHPQTHLAYITDDERNLLANLDMHNSGVSPTNPHYGPQGILSLNGAGDNSGAGDRGDATGGMGPGGAGGGLGGSGGASNSGKGSTGQGGSGGGKGGDGSGNSGSSGNTGGANSSAGGGSDRGGGNDRSGGFGGSVGGGGMGSNNDRGGGGNAAAGLGSDRGRGDPTGGMGPGGAGGGLGQGSGQSNSSAKGDMSTGGITGNKSDAPGITGAPEAQMDSIANAAATQAGLTAGSLLGNNLSVDAISGMGMRSMAQTSPFGAMSPIGSTSEDVNAQNARNAIAGIVGGITAAPSGFAKNQDATIAGIVANASPAARVGQVGMPGLQVSNLAAKGDLAQTSISPQDLSSSQAMNNVPTRDPVAPPAGLIGALPGELAAKAQFGITSAPVEAKTRSISRPGPTATDLSAANNALNSDIIGALNMENAPPSVSVSPANAPGFPAAPDPNADMGVTAPSLNEMPGFMENTATIPSNDYFGRFGPAPTPGSNFIGGRDPNDRGGGGDRGYSGIGGGQITQPNPLPSAGLIDALTQGRAPENLSPYHKSLWEYLYG